MQLRHSSFQLKEWLIPTKSIKNLTWGEEREERDDSHETGNHSIGLDCKPAGSQQRQVEGCRVHILEE